MAKTGGTLTANTNVEVFPADMNRQSLHVHNLDSTANHNIFVEFGTAASTTLTNGSWPVDSGETLTLHVRDFPEIRESINIISAHSSDYVIRTS